MKRRDTDQDKPNYIEASLTAWPLTFPLHRFYPPEQGWWDPWESLKPGDPGNPYEEKYRGRLVGPLDILCEVLYPIKVRPRFPGWIHHKEKEPDKGPWRREPRLWEPQGAPIIAQPATCTVCGAPIAGRYVCRSCESRYGLLATFWQWSDAARQGILRKCADIAARRDAKKTLDHEGFSEPEYFADSDLWQRIKDAPRRPRHGVPRDADYPARWTIKRWDTAHPDQLTTTTQRIPFPQEPIGVFGDDYCIGFKGPGPREWRLYCTRQWLVGRMHRWDRKDVEDPKKGSRGRMIVFLDPWSNHDPEYRDVYLRVASRFERIQPYKPPTLDPTIVFDNLHGPYAHICAICGANLGSVSYYKCNQVCTFKRPDEPHNPHEEPIANPASQWPDWARAEWVNRWELRWRDDKGAVHVELREEPQPNLRGLEARRREEHRATRCAPSTERELLPLPWAPYKTPEENATYRTRPKRNEGSYVCPRDEAIAQLETMDCVTSGRHPAAHTLAMLDPEWNESTAFDYPIFERCSERKRLELNRRDKLNTRLANAHFARPASWSADEAEEAEDEKVDCLEILNGADADYDTTEDIEPELESQYVPSGDGGAFIAERVREAIAALPERKRTIADMVLDDYSDDEIAERFDVHRSTATRWRHDAMRRLVALLCDQDQAPAAATPDDCLPTFGQWCAGTIRRREQAGFTEDQRKQARGLILSIAASWNVVMDQAESEIKTKTRARATRKRLSQLHGVLTSGDMADLCRAGGMSYARLVSSTIAHPGCTEVLAWYLCEPASFKWRKPLFDRREPVSEAPERRIGLAPVTPERRLHQNVGGAVCNLYKGVKEESSEYEGQSTVFFLNPSISDIAIV